MPLPVSVVMHPSQFPEQVRRDLLESLRRREVNHKFLYDGVKQTQKWLELHEACSPSRTDPECAATYDNAFRAGAAACNAKEVCLIALGCGGGQKDTRCMQILQEAGKVLTHLPVDVSVPMVLTAYNSASAIVPGLVSTPVVCDLGTATDLPSLLGALAPPGSRRLITFFGLIPNFEPGDTLRCLAGLLRPGDVLLLSANLVPSGDYESGMRRILPLYDNEPSRQWLFSFLQEFGITDKDGSLLFNMEDGQRGLKRVVARFHFSRDREVRIERECFLFRTGDSIRVFYSYRHTPMIVRELLEEHGLNVIGEWLALSGEEGIFMVQLRD